MRLSVLFALFLLSPAVGLCAPSHCMQDEDVIFSCALQRTKKVVSLCSSKKLLSKNGGAYLQYRFGALGKVELTYPTEKAGSPDKFSYSHYFRPQTDRTQLSFDSGDYSYAIFDEYEDQLKSAGITVRSRKSNKTAQLICAKGESAKWHLLDGAVPCDEEDDPSTCHYQKAR
jgi:hypothetical protein